MLIAWFLTLALCLSLCSLMGVRIGKAYERDATYDWLLERADEAITRAEHPSVQTNEEQRIYWLGQAHKMRALAIKYDATHI